MMRIIKVDCVSFHGFINVNYNERLIVKLSLVGFPGATHSLSLFLFLSLCYISLEDGIIINSFGRGIHEEHVKRRGCWTASRRLLSVSVGICVECRCRLSTVSDSSALLQFCFHILRKLNERSRRLLFTPALSICPSVGNKGTPFPYHLAGFSLASFMPNLVITVSQAGLSVCFRPFHGKPGALCVVNENWRVIRL